MAKKLKRVASGKSDGQFATAVKDSAGQIWLAGLGAFVERLAVEGMGAARDARARLGLDHVGAGERRERHRVRAHLGQLVSSRPRLGDVPGAALQRGGTDLVRHASLVAGGPGRRTPPW